MPISVFSNNIAMPDRRKAIQEAVLAGTGSSPGSQTWQVFIFEPQSSPEYIVKIEGPEGFTWERSFLGVQEQTAQFIGAEVRRATHYPGNRDPRNRPDSAPGPWPSGSLILSPTLSFGHSRRNFRYSSFAALFIRATARPTVRADTPRIEAHSA